MPSNQDFISFRPTAISRNIHGSSRSIASSGMASRRLARTSSILLSEIPASRAAVRTSPVSGCRDCSFTEGTVSVVLGPGVGSGCCEGSGEVPSEARAAGRLPSATLCLAFSTSLLTYSSSSCSSKLIAGIDSSSPSETESFCGPGVGRTSEESSSCSAVSSRGGDAVPGGEQASRLRRSCGTCNSTSRRIHSSSRRSLSSRLTGLPRPWDFGRGTRVSWAFSAGDATSGPGRRCCT
mmetsp:Transcript_88768/g.259423  ORF Transcript_88768/g.259423 Transcript_88768/m.259423 type:complete len:237 (+) Transcript_88768:169-879(+)